MTTIASRVVRLEQDPRRGRHRFSHEEALAVLDADPEPLAGHHDFSDAELDAEWDRLLAEWREGA